MSEGKPHFDLFQNESQVFLIALRFLLGYSITIFIQENKAAILFFFFNHFLASSANF
jgi:hypothetical protein